GGGDDVVPLQHPDRLPQHIAAHPVALGQGFFRGQGVPGGKSQADNIELDLQGQNVDPAEGAIRWGGDEGQCGDGPGVADRGAQVKVAAAAGGFGEEVENDFAGFPRGLDGAVEVGGDDPGELRAAHLPHAPGVGALGQASQGATAQADPVTVSELGQ